MGGSFPYLSNGGVKVLSGQATVSLVFHNVPPTGQIYGYLEQTAGGQWNFFSAWARFPYPDLLGL